MRALGPHGLTGVGMWRDEMVFLAGVLAALTVSFAGNARAALVIEICGHSSYTCNSGDSSSGSFPPGSDIRAVEVDGGSSSAKIPVSPNEPLPTPSGWTPAVAPSVQPTPPGSASLVESYSCTSGVGPYSGATREAACQAVVDQLNVVDGPTFSYTLGTCAPTSCVIHKFSSGVCGGACADASGSVSDTSSCPAGYTAGGGSCTLSNASLVIKPVDGKCGIVRSSGVFTADANDPDCTGGVVTASGDTASASDGGQSAQVKINGDGSVTITDSRPSGDGNTQVTRIHGSAPDGSGEVDVVGWSRNWTEGWGEGGSEDGADVGCGAPGQPPCKIDETGTPTDGGSLAAANSSLDTAVAAGESGIGTYATSAKQSDLGVTLTVSWPDVACSNPSFDVFGRPLVVEFCAYEDDVDAVMSWLVYVLGAFTVFGMIREVR